MLSDPQTGSEILGHGQRDFWASVRTKTASRHTAKTTLQCIVFYFHWLDTNITFKSDGYCFVKGISKGNSSKAINFNFTFYDIYLFVVSSLTFNVSLQLIFIFIVFHILYLIFRLFLIYLFIFICYQMLLLVWCFFYLYLLFVYLILAPSGLDHINQFNLRCAFKFAWVGVGDVVRSADRKVDSWARAKGSCDLGFS